MSELLCRQGVLFTSVERVFFHTVQEFEMTYWNSRLVHFYYVESIKFYKLARLSNVKYVCTFLFLHMPAITRYSRTRQLLQEHRTKFTGLLIL